MQSIQEGNQYQYQHSSCCHSNEFFVFCSTGSLPNQMPFKHKEATSVEKGNRRTKKRKKAGSASKAVADQAYNAASGSVPSHSTEVEGKRLAKKRKRPAAAASAVAGPVSSSAAVGSASSKATEVEAIDKPDDEAFDKNPPCSHCKTRNKWSKMESWKKWLTEDEDNDVEDRVFVWQYRCKDCVKRQENIATDHEAMGFIFQRNGYSNEKMIRAEKFSHARANVLESFSFFGIEKKGRTLYALSRSFMVELFGGLSEFILLKSRQMEIVAEEVEACKAKIEELNACTDPERIKILIEEIEKQVADDRIKQLSFDGRPEMVYAAAYTDEWEKIGNGHFRHYFICLAGGADPCLHMITSKGWTQKFPGEAWHAGQRWYCEDNTWGQQHLYRAKWGVIIELRRGNKIYYNRAEVPDKTKIDILALKYEKKHGSKLTAAELYKSIPIVHPTVTELVIPVKPDKGIVSNSKRTSPRITRPWASSSSATATTMTR